MFNGTGGEGWFNAWGWKTGAHPSRWHGVATDSEGRVTGIDLSGPFGNGLTGSIPAEVGRLSELARLDLSGNDLCVPRSIVDNLPSTGLGTCAVFADAMGNTHEAALEALAGRGILDGTECAAGICPNAPIERWAMAVWLVRAIDGREPLAVSTSRFADVDTDTWWTPYVERLAELRDHRGMRSPAAYVSVLIARLHGVRWRRSWCAPSTSKPPRRQDSVTPVEASTG